MKVDAFPVDLHRETAGLSNSADKKHGELRVAQRADMVRLKEETDYLAFEMKGQDGVAHHMTASVRGLGEKIAAGIGNCVEDVKSEREGRSREVANLVTAVHSGALVAYTIGQPHTACSKDSKEGFCADADWICRLLNIARICGTFGDACVGLDRDLNALQQFRIVNKWLM